VLGPTPKSKIEGNKLTIVRDSPTQCPALQVEKRINVPLETVCKTVAFHMFRVAEAVNPKAQHKSIQIHSKKCIDEIEIP
jgi:hypothetical protein